MLVDTFTFENLYYLCHRKSIITPITKVIICRVNL